MGERVKQREKSRQQSKRKAEGKLEFGDDFYRFPVQQLKFLILYAVKHKIGYREAISLALSKLPEEYAEDVKE